MRIASARVARVVSWLVPILALLVGILFFAAGEIGYWSAVADPAGTYESHEVDVSVLGVVLIGSGVLTLSAAAIAERVMSQSRAG